MPRLISIISAMLLVGSACVAPCDELVNAENDQTAIIDTLVWDIEQLEFEAKVQKSSMDSLKIVNRYLEWRLERAEDNERKWYHDPRLHFLAGAAAMAFMTKVSISR